MVNRTRAPNDAAIIEKETWGVPIWSSEDGYPKISDRLTPDKWKWEFLRRTKEYRDDWELAKIASTLPRPRARHKILPKRNFDEKLLVNKYGLSHPVPPQSSYRDLPKEFSFVRWPEIPNGGMIVYPRTPVPELGKGKDRQKNAIILQGEQSCATISERDLENYAKNMPLSAPSDWYGMRVWVEYDLGYSLQEQLQAAEDNLNAARDKLQHFMYALDGSNEYWPQKVGERKKRSSEKAKNHKDKMQLLHVMDAKNCGIGNDLIVRKLYDLGYASIDTSTVSKQYKVALQLWKIL